MLKLDKRTWIADNLHKDSRGGPADNWKQIKQLRRVYQPKPPISKDKTGHIDTTRSKGDILGEYLQDKVWNPIQTDHVFAVEPKYLPEKTYLDPFQISELHAVISRFKTNKAPGSDMIKQEWIKWSSPVFKACILQMCNQCFTAQVVPVEWTHSEVVMLPKPKNTRPITSFCQSPNLSYPGIL